MQQPFRAESPPQRDAAADRSLVQKFFGSAEPARAPQRIAEPPQEDNDLDQRVRQSGEW